MARRLLQKDKGIIGMTPVCSNFQVYTIHKYTFLSSKLRQFSLNAGGYSNYFCIIICEFVDMDERSFKELKVKLDVPRISLCSSDQ